MDLPIVLNRDSSVPLKHQLYEEIRRLILSGHWAPGYKLPSTRFISEALQISRPTTNQAFAELLNQGFIHTYAGSGTFVSRDLPDKLLQTHRNNRNVFQEPPKAMLPLSACGEYLRSQGKYTSQIGPHWVQSPDNQAKPFDMEFRGTPPNLKYFPINQWQKLLTKNWRAQISSMNQETNPKGFYPLRQAIADYVFRARAIRCTPDQVIIVNGAQQGLNLIARVHLNSGDPVAIEDPGYNGARYVFQSYCAQVWPIPVDDSGLHIDTLEALDTINFKLLYLTPSHQLPIGSVLSLPRRLKVIHWAQQNGSIIVEDDYDGEFRYNSPPIPALAALDNSGQSVVYVRTFSKAVFTALRIGYLIVPEPLVDIYTWAKRLEDSAAPLLEQAALAEFMQNGSFEKYIRRMHKVYGSKRRLLEKALKSYFGDAVTILGESAGLFLTARFKTNLDDETILKKLAELDVGIRTTARDYLSNTYTKSEFLMGYGDVNEKKIEETVARMARVILNKK